MHPTETNTLPIGGKYLNDRRMLMKSYGDQKMWYESFEEAKKRDFCRQ